MVLISGERSNVNFPGGGKSRLAEKFLSENGWVQIARHQQSFWVHVDNKKTKIINIAVEL